MERYLLDKNWEYVESGLQNPLMVDLLKGWKKTNLPHDYAMEKARSKNAPGGLDEGFTQGAGLYYRKNFILEKAAAGKRVWIEFEGVSGVTEVWVNQKFVAKHINPYTSFWVDITSCVKTGENTVSLHTDSSCKPCSRWYVGAGLYRPVWLYIAEETAAVPHGVRITTEKLEPGEEPESGRCAYADLSVDMELLVSEKWEGKQIPIRLEVLSEDGVQIYQANSVSEAGSMENADDAEKKDSFRSFAKEKICLGNIVSWDPEHPYLYTFRLTVADNDIYEEKFGIRTVMVSAEHGFRLNGKTLKLKGGCIHHDLGIFGAAEYEDAERRKIRKLKESGYNALRLAHNPFGNTFFKICDEMGMLVIEEAFDEWVLGRTSFGSHLFFEQSWEQDLEAMISRDYNHPSIIMWSVGNEVEERDGSADGYIWSKRLAGKVRELDASRPVSATACSLFVEYTQARPKEEEGTTGNQALNMAYDNFASGTDLWGDATAEYFAPMDVAGYNYKTARYEFDHEKFPERVIYGSESYPRAAYQAWKAAEENVHVIGDFVWTAWDYIGEVGVGRWEVSEDQSRPQAPAWPWLLANCSDIDLIGCKRPQSYYRDAIWGNDHAPHLFTLAPELVGKNIARLSWAWLPVQKNYTFENAQGQSIEAHVYANADQVELLVNGKSLGRMECGGCKEYQVVFSFSYEKGKLEAIAYVGGKESGRDVLRTAAETEALLITPEEEQLVADGRSLMFLMVSAMDAQGIPVVSERRSVEIQVENGELVAAGTADPKPDRILPFAGNVLPLYEGKALIAIKSEKPGEVCTVKVRLQNTCEETPDITQCDSTDTVGDIRIEESLEIPLLHKEATQSRYVSEPKDSAVNLTIGELLENDKTRKVLEEYMPQLVNNPMITHMRSMTLKKVAAMGGMALPDELVRLLEQASTGQLFR